MPGSTCFSSPSPSPTPVTPTVTAEHQGSPFHRSIIMVSRTRMQPPFPPLSPPCCRKEGRKEGAGEAGGVRRSLQNVGHNHHGLPQRGVRRVTTKLMCSKAQLSPQWCIPFNLQFFSRDGRLPGLCPQGVSAAHVPRLVVSHLLCAQEEPSAAWEGDGTCPKVTQFQASCQSLTLLQ